VNEEFEKMRAEVIAWMTGTYPDVYTLDAAEIYWDENHVSALAWQASRKQALNDAVGVCKDLAIQAHEDAVTEEDERYRIYAKKYARAAAAIRALQKE
jgi:hypothetical protein